MTRFASCTCGPLSLEPCGFHQETVDPSVAALSKTENRLRRLVDRLENVRAGVMDSEHHPCGHDPADPEDSCRGSCVRDEIDRLEREIPTAEAARDAAAAEVDLDRAAHDRVTS